MALKLGGLFLAILVVWAAVFAVTQVIIPFYFELREPFFLMPVDHDGPIHELSDLPIRYDSYGDGHFGAKRSGGRRHNGLDLVARKNQAVYASKSGWARSIYIPSGYGNLIVIHHPGGRETRYGHLDSITVKGTRWVRRGDIIGYAGKTGNANVKGMIRHLHFEIREGGEPLNPVPFLIKDR